MAAAAAARRKPVSPVMQSIAGHTHDVWRYRDVRSLQSARRRYLASPMSSASLASALLCQPPIAAANGHMLSAANIHLASGGPHAESLR